MGNEVKTNVGMGCYEHNDRTVVATCPKCGKFMCRECAEKYKSKLCESCENERIKEEEEKAEQQKARVKNNAKANVETSKKQLRGVIIKSAIFGIIGILLGMDSGSFVNGLIFAYIFAALPWGWKYVKNAIDTGEWAWLAAWTNNIWLLVFGIFFKFALAILIGIFAMPIGIFKAIKNFNDAKKMQENINKNYK